MRILRDFAVFGLLVASLYFGLVIWPTMADEIDRSFPATAMK